MIDQRSTTRGGLTDGTSVDVRGGDIEKALRLFKRKLAREGVFRDVKERRHYEKPSIKRRKKSEEARKRERKSSR